MIAALIELVARKALIALYTVKLYHTGKKLPKEVSPWDLFRTQAKHKFVELKAFVGDVRSL